MVIDNFSKRFLIEICVITQLVPRDTFFCPTRHDTHAKTLPLKYLVFLILQVILYILVLYEPP